MEPKTKKLIHYILIVGLILIVVLAIILAIVLSSSKDEKENKESQDEEIDIVNSYNNRSLLNISGQWTQMSADHLIKENTFRINIGVTFNERWFMKWKFD